MTQICIIDDDAISIFGLRRAIEATKIIAEVKEFEDSTEALDYFKSCLSAQVALPQYIFLDLNMPVLDGWDFLTDFSVLVSDKAKQPQIYIMTSSIDLKDIEKAKKFKVASNYLVKPVTANVLKGILK